MPPRRLPRALATVVVGAALGAAATACATSAATQGGNGYIAGDGVVQTYAPGDRQDAPDVSGQTIDGKPIDLADDLGKVVVVNVWASWCGECRGEAADLEKAYHELPQAAFLGIDANEDAKSAAIAFQRNHPVPYPSIYDADGAVLLGFYGLVRPDALPSTLVIDQQGRIAALVNGPVDSSTLIGLVHDIEAAS